MSNRLTPETREVYEQGTKEGYENGYKQAMNLIAAAMACPYCGHGKWVCRLCDRPLGQPDDTFDDDEDEGDAS